VGRFTAECGDEGVIARRSIRKVELAIGLRKAAGIPAQWIAREIKIERDDTRVRQTIGRFEANPKRLGMCFWGGGSPIAHRYQQSGMRTPPRRILLARRPARRHASGCRGAVVQDGHTQPDIASRLSVSTGLAGEIEIAEQQIVQARHLLFVELASICRSAVVRSIASRNLAHRRVRKSRARTPWVSWAIAMARRLFDSPSSVRPTPRHEEAAGPDQAAG